MTDAPCIDCGTDHPTAWRDRRCADCQQAAVMRVIGWDSDRQQAEIDRALRAIPDLRRKPKTLAERTHAAVFDEETWLADPGGVDYCDGFCEYGEDTCRADCLCGRGSFNHRQYRSCYYCFLDRADQFRACIFCGRWHSRRFNTCYACRQLSGRDEASVWMRFDVLIRDVVCQMCGEPDADMQIDHIKPCSAGGDARPWNLQALCGPCNRRKSNTWWEGGPYSDMRDRLLRYYLLRRSLLDDDERQALRREVDRWRQRHPVVDKVADLPTRPAVPTPVGDFTPPPQRHVVEGPCVRCSQPTRRYGDGGDPLCAKCRVDLVIEREADDGAEADDYGDDPDMPTYTTPTTTKG